MEVKKKKKKKKREKHKNEYIERYETKIFTRNILSFSKNIHKKIIASFDTKTKTKIKHIIIRTTMCLA